MYESAMLKIEVAYARPERQFLIPLKIPAGTTAMEAVKLSGMMELCPEIDWENIKIGIYSRPVQWDAVLQDNDRVEIYRPLTIDPKQKRIIRAKKSNS